MKLAFVFTSFPSSGETSNISRITGLIDRKHDIHIFALAPLAGYTKIHEDVLEYKLLEKVTYHGKSPQKINILKELARDFISMPIVTWQRIIRSCNTEYFPKRFRVMLRGLLFREVDVTGLRLALMPSSG